MNLSACASWICKGNTKSPPTPTEHNMTTVQSGPGPSPGSSGSCDDIIPPPKNCYRLVVLGEISFKKYIWIIFWLSGSSVLEIIDFFIAFIDPILHIQLSYHELGSARVGKTSLVSRFLGGKFEESYTPTIEDFHRKLYRIRGEIHQLDILDTSGNHPFPAMRRLSFLTGYFNVVCCDVYALDCWCVMDM